MKHALVAMLPIERSSRGWEIKEILSIGALPGNPWSEIPRAGFGSKSSPPVAHRELRLILDEWCNATQDNSCAAQMPKT